MYTVYLALNRANSKVYVGFTKFDALRRFKKHCQDAEAGRTTHLCNALRKFGPEVFSVFTLWHGDSRDEAKQLEIELIEDLNLQNPTFGYNMTQGGDGIDSEIIVRTNLRRFSNPSAHRHMSLKMRGNRNCIGKQNALGYRHSPETLEKMKISHTGRKHSLESRKKRSESMKAFYAARLEEQAA